VPSKATRGRYWSFLAPAGTASATGCAGPTRGPAATAVSRTSGWAGAPDAVTRNTTTVTIDEIETRRVRVITSPSLSSPMIGSTDRHGTNG
jgi:hypothetical protein